MDTCGGRPGKPGRKYRLESTSPPSHSPSWNLLPAQASAPQLAQAQQGSPPCHDSLGAGAEGLGASGGGPQAFSVCLSLGTGPKMPWFWPRDPGRSQVLKAFTPLRLEDDPGSPEPSHAAPVTPGDRPDPAGCDTPPGPSLTPP